MNAPLHLKFAFGFTALLVAVGALFYWAESASSERYHLELTQRLNAPIAMYVADSAPLIRDGAPDEAALRVLAERAMIVNPSAEIYLLDTAGQVLFPAPAQDALDRVDVAPVTSLVAGDARLPVLGDDPRGTGTQRVFSAHPVTDAGALAGYVYVILGGTAYETTAAAVAGGYQQRIVIAAIALTLAGALVTGWALFRRVTRRLGRLTAKVDAFRADGNAGPNRVDHGDELTRLDRAFDTMSERIVGQVRQLRDADRLRRELIGNVSHDLRTPLASMRGYIDTLVIKDASLDANQRRELLATAQRNADRLSTLVSDLFDLSRLDAGSITPQPEPFCLAELANDVAQEFALRARDAGIALRVAPPEAPVTVLADIGLIQRVLENLIDNALKHTPDGGRVDIVVEPHVKRCAIAVADTGSGIDSAHLPHVFDRHYAVPGRAGKASATGLGLAIVKKILDLHEAPVTVDSAPERGTEVRFDLPAAA
ncbi:MAG: HAMP domain-containing sensor histidine kinase [Pseudomonadota bacterium]